MKQHLIPIYLTITIGIFITSTTHAQLAVKNILGIQGISERAQVEVYANTKGELWYNLIVDNQPRGGSQFKSEVGDNTYFYWDDANNEFWILSKEQVSRSAFGDNRSSESTTYNLLNVEAMNPPQEVRAIVEALKGE